MADYGVTDSGFVRKPFVDIYSSLVTRFRSKLGNDFDVTDGSINQQFIGTFADELDLSWQAAQGVYSSQTVNGAEGVFLDDIFSQQGVFRQGKTAGGGQVGVFSNLATATYGHTIPSGSAVTALNNIIYRTQDPVVIDGFGSCYSLSATQITTGVSYTFQVYNIDAPKPQVFSWTPTSDADKDNMLLALSQWLTANVTETEYPSYYNALTRTCYVGFNPNNNLPAPLQNGKLYVNASPKVGTLGSTVSVLADTKGFYPLSVQGVVALTATYTGYTGVVNFTDFSSGTDVETDAEYRVSFIKSDAVASTNTADSIRTSLLNLESITDCIVYENPTEFYAYDRYDNLATLPYTTNVVVLGGSDEEIAEVLAVKVPLGGNLYGTTSYTYKNRLYKFTRAEYLNLGVKVVYKLKDNTSFTEVDVRNLNDIFKDLVNSLQIGDELIGDQFKSAAYSVIPYQKVKYIEVTLKDTDAVGDYRTSLSPEYNQKSIINSGDVLFERLPA